MAWIARCLCLFLLCASAVHAAEDGLPLPPLREPRIAAPSIDGAWVTRNGTRIDITQQGDRIELRSASGRVYSGTLKGRRLDLAHAYAAPTDAGMSEALRAALRDARATFVGDVAADGQSIEARLTEVEVRPDARGTAIADRRETRTDVTLTRYKPPAEIVAVFVAADQTAQRNGLVLYKHPSNDSFGRAQRNLLVVGRNLPRRYAEAKVESSDPEIDYTILRLPSDPPERYADDVQSAIALMNRALDRDLAAKVLGMERMLVRASFGRKVLPGTKTFTLNGQSRRWRLAFGDTRGDLRFVRAIDEQRYEPTDEVFLPETISIELRVSAKLEIDPIRVIVQPQGAAGGAPLVLPAAPVSEQRSRDGDYVVRYRTPPIQVAEARGNAPAPANVQRVIAAAQDKLVARLENPELLMASPAQGSLFTGSAATPDQVSAAATVRRTPNELGVLWKDALTTAAQCAGKPVHDFSQLPGQEAAEITNYILFTTDDLARRILTQRPFYERKLSVKVSDHAAMLLLRAEFVRLMQEQAARLPSLADEATLRGFRQLIKPYADSEAFPLSHLRVTPPPGGARGCGPASLDVAFGQVLQRLVSPALNVFRDSCPFPFAFNETFLERTFGADRAAADRWALGAVKEGFDTYRSAVDRTITKAKSIGNCQVEELVKLTGYDFTPVADRLLPKLVRLEESNRTVTWVPDRPARSAVVGLDSLAKAVRDQKNYSDLDTQCIVMTAGVVAAVPALVSGAPLAALAAGVGNFAIASTDAALQIRDYVEREREVDRATGASLVLGTERLSAAELQRTSVWQIAVALANVGMASAEVLGALSQVNRAAAVARGSKLVSQVESGGTAALRRLSDAEKRDVLLFIADAELTKAARGEGALSGLQRSGLKAGHALDADPRVAAELARLNGLDPGDAVGREIKRLIDRDRDAVDRAHRIGAGELGADGVNPAAVGNYSPAQLRRKAEILRAAGYSSDEIRLLMESRVVGVEPPRFSTPFDIAGLNKRPTDGWLRTPGNEAVNVGSPTVRPQDRMLRQQEFITDTLDRLRIPPGGSRGAEAGLREALSHAEGEAARVANDLAKKGITEAFLDINNPRGPCDACKHWVESMLPPDFRLTVRWGDGPGNQRVYIGLQR